MICLQGIQVGSGEIKRSHHCAPAQCKRVSVHLCATLATFALLRPALQYLPISKQSEGITHAVQQDSGVKAVIVIREVEEVVAFHGHFEVTLQAKQISDLL